MEREFKHRYGVEGEALYPIPGNPLRNLCPQRQQEPLVVGYFGSLGRGYEQPMLCLADALAERGGRLVVASRTPRSIAAEVWRHPAVTDLGVLHPAQVEPTLAEFGVNVLCVVQSFHPADGRVKFNFPSKMTEYLMLGLPILVLSPEHASVPLWLVDEPHAALLVTSPTPEAFEAPISRLSEAAERVALARGAREAAGRYTSFGLATQFESALINLVSRQVPRETVFVSQR